MCKMRLRYKHYGDYVVDFYKARDWKEPALLAYPIKVNDLIDVQTADYITRTLGRVVPNNKSRIIERRRYICAR